MLSKVAFGAVAVGSLLTTSAFGATSTWTNNTNLSAAQRVWTASSNWSGGVPAGIDEAVFGPGGAALTYGVTINAATNELSSLKFSGGSGSYITSGGGSGTIVVNGSIVNDLTRVLPATGLGAGSLGLGSVVIQSVTLNGNTALSGIGAGTEFKSIGGTGKLTVSNTNIILNGAFTGDITATAGGIIKYVGNTSSGDLVNGANATFVGNGLTGDTNTFIAGANKINLVASSNTNVRVGWNGSATFNDNFQAGTSVTYGGALNIDFTQVGSKLYAPWTTVASLFDAPSFLGDLDNVTLTGVVPYTPLTFTKNGSEWVSGYFPGPGGNPEYLVFRQNTGDLVVVPEPSTMVFAGVGVAMAGWSVWKKRRLAKLAKIA